MTIMFIKFSSVHREGVTKKQEYFGQYTKTEGGKLKNKQSEVLDFQFGHFQKCLNSNNSHTPPKITQIRQ